MISTGRAKNEVCFICQCARSARNYRPLRVVAIAPELRQKAAVFSLLLLATY